MSCLFFFNDPAPTEIYPLSLHDALPICRADAREPAAAREGPRADPQSACSAHRQVSGRGGPAADRKSTRLNSSHLVISYAVFCLEKKKQFNTIAGARLDHQLVAIPGIRL